ncbi:MAG: NAD(P)(+) transhydrogenase (Re/Si-specific) subunit beta [Planctomycetota bacterium]|jgi:NAD(P) transhydrogenase subunit beta
MTILIDFAYILAAVLFIFGMKMLSSAETARRGNLVSALGMLVAVVATVCSGGLSFTWIIVGLIIGGLIGGVAARLVQMTQMPEMVGIFNGFGGMASFLVAWAEYHKLYGALNADPGLEAPFVTVTAIFFAVLVGGITFTGSLIAWAKLAGKMETKPILFKSQQLLNVILITVAFVMGILLVVFPEAGYVPFIFAMILALIIGVMTVIPIGGADMPVVIALLNSYSGLAACAAGFIIYNNVLIVAGSLVGASGLILTNIMCKAMNRSIANVLFSGFGADKAQQPGYKGEAKTISAEDTYLILEAASSVVFVPGYGMAVAQAQHAVRELGDLLEENGCDVKYVIHPVAGRMPGHMNVLLAEANVAYEQLVEPQDVNPVMATVDVAMIIGANDVVNPASRSDQSSPIFGMPIIDVDYAKTVIVMKRSLRPGFAGIDNPLFFNQNTRMLLGDAKDSTQALVSEFKE